MRAVDLIRTKRDGGELDRAAIEWFVAGVTDGNGLVTGVPLTTTLYQETTSDPTTIKTTAKGPFRVTVLSGKKTGSASVYLTADQSLTITVS